jgi:hypothetical protein
LLGLVLTAASLVAAISLRAGQTAWFAAGVVGMITGRCIWDIVRALYMRRQERERGVIYFERLRTRRWIPRVAGKASSLRAAPDASVVYARLMRGEGARPEEIAALADSPARINADSADVYRRAMAGGGTKPDEIAALAPATDRLTTTWSRWLYPLSTAIDGLSGEPERPLVAGGPFIAVPSPGGRRPPPPVGPAEPV